MHHTDCTQSRGEQALETARHCKLDEGQTLLLTHRIEPQCFVRLTFQEGVARVGASFGERFSDITVGFCGCGDEQWVQVPSSIAYFVEALCPCSLELMYSQQCPVSQDLICQWLFDLHLVRHPVGAEARLVHLLQLLVNRFGIRSPQGYELPFTLSHARMGELIGATRSTVTRQITTLRDHGLLHLTGGKECMLLSAELVETDPFPGL